MNIGGIIMSKTVKRVVVVLIIICLLFSVSMLIASYGFKPTVTLDYGYTKLKRPLAYLIRGQSALTDDDYVAVIESKPVVRFSHYQAPIPTRDGYTFAGWYKDIGHTVAWINGQDTVSRDITLYAKWIKAT